MRGALRKKPMLALVVYAKRNVRDMAERAFRSIAKQKRKPDKLIVIDDDSEAGFDDVKERVLDLRLEDCHVQVLRNERTQGLCGSLNTAILKLMEYADEEKCYVSFLREEDELVPAHFEVLEKATKGCAEAVVLTDIQVKGRSKPIEMLRRSTPQGHLARLFSLDLDLASCLMGAVAVRLDVLMEAGMFNEALRGMQTYEMLLRISELPALSWTATSKTTLIAPPSGYRTHERTDGVVIDRRRELTSSVILDMRRGSRAFCLLAKHRLEDPVERSLFGAIKGRIRKRDRRTSAKRWGIGYDLKPTTFRKIRIRPLDSEARRNLNSAHLVVGVISRSNQEAEKCGLVDLLKELEWLSGQVGSVHVCILDNADGTEKPKEWFLDLPRSGPKFVVETFRAKFDSADATAKGYKASIAVARSAVQRHVAAYIRRSPGLKSALAWFLDEDLSLVNRAMCWDDGESRDWFLGQLAALLTDLKSEAVSKVAMILGQVTEAPPIPGTMTFRLQLLDAVTALRRLRLADAEGKYCYRDFQRVLEKWFSPGREIRDYYYDVSSRDLIHLEFPFDYFPWDNGEFRRSKLTNGDVLRKVIHELPKLAKGKQVFRPIFADRHFAVDPAEMKEDGFPAKTSRDKISHSPSVLRGGNTLLPVGADADKYPTVTLKGLKYGRKSLTPRRADMVSAVICRYLHGKEVTACALPVRQRREDEGNKSPNDLLNPRKYVPDTEGFAIYTALKSVLDDRQLARLDTKAGRHACEECDFKQSDVDRFFRAVSDARKLRSRSIISSFYRVRGLARILEQELRLCEGFMNSTEDRQALRQSLDFAVKLQKALRRGFDLHDDKGRHHGQKILSTSNPMVRYPKADVTSFLKKLRLHVPPRP